jgi:hypothetical protein
MAAFPISKQRMNSMALTHKERHKANFLKTRAVQTVPVREPILIVCEDSKSSVFYFREKRDDLRLDTAKVKVTGESGSHPSSVVEYARLEYEKNRADCRKTGEVPYQHVYCVFDIDDHPNVSAAIQRARDLNFIPIVSNQCFELWYLLHFIEGAPGWLHRDDLCKMLSKIIGKEYEKGAKGMYSLIKHSEAKAIILATRLIADAIETSDERNPYRNPSTEVHILVAKLNATAKRH